LHIFFESVDTGD